MAQRMEEYEASSTKAKKIIEEQSKQIEEKEQEGSSDVLISKDKEIIPAAETLQGKEQIFAEMPERLEETEALLTTAMKRLSKNQRR